MVRPAIVYRYMYTWTRNGESPKVPQIPKIPKVPVDPQPGMR